jgi:hypothetical protein
MLVMQSFSLAAWPQPQMAGLPISPSHHPTTTHTGFFFFFFFFFIFYF